MNMFSVAYEPRMTCSILRSSCNQTNSCLPRYIRCSNNAFVLHSNVSFRKRSSFSRINCCISSTIDSSTADDVLKAEKIQELCKKWLWKGQYSINYFVSDSHSTNPPLLLVHGFGASIPHWRRNINILAQDYTVYRDGSRTKGVPPAPAGARAPEGTGLNPPLTVYAIDLLGFGASDKPKGFSYTMESWSQLILDFLEEVIQKPTVLVGNSVGSLACVIAASDSSQSLVRGLVLLNCAGGMNNKAIVDDWRIKLLLPLLWLIDFLLNQRFIASAIFNNVKKRDTIKNILLSVYGNKESVDEELVEIIRNPALDEGAVDAFVSIVTGPPGPNPVQLMPKISIAVLVLWGDDDPFTPLDGPVGKYFSSLPSKLSNVKLCVLQGVGHCPHDDRPHLVHDNLLPWLAQLDSS